VGSARFGLELATRVEMSRPQKNYAAITARPLPFDIHRTSRGRRELWPDFGDGL